MVEAPRQKGIMTTEMLETAASEGKVFRVGESFLFAAQIPDDSVGCSGSRCSNCGGETGYCVEICSECHLPLVGPFGFPQLPVWSQQSLEEKTRTAQEVYSSNNHGRLVWANVESVPLHPSEVGEVEKLKGHDAELFLATHEIPPQEIRKILLS